MSQIQVSMPPGFEAVSILGKGAMGKVYKAWQPKLQRFVAIKTCTLLESEEKGQDFARLQAEALTIAQINHPNIVTLIDVESDDQAIYLIMEYLDGPTLAQLLNPSVTLEQLKGYDELLNTSGKTRTMSETWLLETGLCVGKALDYAHGRKVLHRDIKPANIIVTEAKNIKLLDFSISRSADPQVAETKPGTVFGTVQYMSPEQILSHPLDGRTDIYSLGCTLYHLATGKVPFVDDNEITVCMNHVNAVPQDVRELNPQLSDATAEVIMQCLEKDMRDRFSSAQELVNKIKKLQRTITSNMRLTAVVVPEQVDQSPAPQPESVAESTSESSQEPVATEESSVRPSESFSEQKTITEDEEPLEPQEEAVIETEAQPPAPQDPEPVAEPKPEPAPQLNESKTRKSDEPKKNADEEASFRTTKPTRSKKITSLEELAIKNNEDTDTSFLEAVIVSEGIKSTDPSTPGSSKAVYEPQSFAAKLMDHDMAMIKKKKKSAMLVYKIIILLVIISILILASYLVMM